jgi:general secretion pathway protein L
MNPLNSTALAPLRVRLEQWRGQWQGSPLQRAWQLWLAELQGMLPPVWRQRLGQGAALQKLDWADLAGATAQAPALDSPGVAPRDSAEVSPPDLNNPRPRYHPAPDARVQLMLPASALMVQRLTLPLAAVGKLRTVLAFEMDRYTPFNAAQLYFDARILSRDKRQAQVLLVAVLRDRLQPILDDCQQRSLPLHAIDGYDAQGEPLQIDLLPAELKPRRAASHRFDRILGLACGVLLLACMVLWLDQRQALLETMQAEVAEQHQQIEQVQRLRAELLNTRGAARYLAQHKTAQAPLSQVLAELTECLGNDTWLEQLEISDAGDLTLSGQSAKASDLIGRVKACPSLVDAHFQGIIQPDASSGKDRFSLRAQLRKEAADAPSPERP